METLTNQQLTTPEVLVDEKPNPSKIMQTGMGFFASKTLLTAVNMKLFTLLGNKKLSGHEIQSKLWIHQRSLYDFLDALVAMGFLNRTGIKEIAMYSNTKETALFLDANKPEYIGGILEMANNRLYPFWNNLEDGLKTGKPQNEIINEGESLFDALYSDPEKLTEFIEAMSGVQMGNFIRFASDFDFSGYALLCDIGGAGGYLSSQVALHNPHMRCISFDLPEVSPIAEENIKNMSVDDRVSVVSGDFFTDDFPEADIITMGNVLHDWSTSDKKMLIKKAYDALPQGGALVVIENIIDDDRRENAFGLLMSLNMLIETGEGFDFTGADFDGWAKEAGFTDTWVIPLTGPTSAAIAIK